MLRNKIQDDVAIYVLYALNSHVNSFRASGPGMIFRFIILSLTGFEITLNIAVLSGVKLLLIILILLQI